MVLKLNASKIALWGIGGLIFSFSHIVTANASLIYDDVDVSTGTGFGTQNNILTVQLAGGGSEGGSVTDTEEGKVAWDDNLGMDVLSGGQVISGDVKTRTYTFSELGIVEASQILFEWNPAEVGQGQKTQVDALTMSIYRNDGNGVADYWDSLAAPVFHEFTINNGVGGNGFDYHLNAQGIINLNNWLSSEVDFSSYRIGLYSLTSYVDNGPDTWTVRSVGDPSTPVPEPATMLLFGSGLIGLAGFSARRKKK